MENKFYEKNISGLSFEFQKWLILTFDFEDNSMTSPKRLDSSNFLIFFPYFRALWINRGEKPFFKVTNQDYF